MIGKTKTNLSNGNSWYAYSGVIVGDVSSPSTIQMLDIQSTGLRDSWIKIQPFYARPISVADNESLGIIVKINDEEIFKSQPKGQTYAQEGNTTFPIELFVERQSTIEILSLNTSANNGQERGVNIVGWFN